MCFLGRSLILFALAALPALGQIQNGGFELGSINWTTTGHFPVFTRADRANSGASYAYTGVSADLITPKSGTIYQTITVPSGVSSALLEFQLWVASDEGTGGDWDVLQLQILNGTGTVTHQAEAGYYSNKDKAGTLNSGTRGYTRRTVSLNSYIGQTIRIQFKSTVGGAPNTIFRIDDVALVTTQALPNLTPYQPNGWSNKIVISKTMGTNTDDGPITSNDNLYVDWAYVNNGEGQTQFDPSASLYLDGSLVETAFANSRLQPNHFASRSDLSLGKLSVGSHTLELVVDQPGVITESNESNADNRFSRTFGVSNPPAPSVDRLVAANGVDNVVPAIAGQQTINVYGSNFSYGGSFKVRMLWTGDFKDLAANQITQISATHFQVLVNIGSNPDAWAIIVTNSNGQVSSPRFFTALPYPAGFTLQSPLYSEASSGPTVQLTWGASNHADGYDVLRENVVIASLSGSARTYLDSSTFARGQRYSYKVRAKNAVGSIDSNGISVTIPSANAPIITLTSPPSGSSWAVGTTIGISWTLTGVTSGVTGIKVSILNNNGLTYSTNLPQTATSFDWPVPSGFVTSTGTVRVEALGNAPHADERAIVTTAASPATLLARITSMGGNPVPATLAVNKGFQFSASQSSGPITSYHWRFSDGSTSNLQNPFHVFKISQDGYGFAQLSLNSPQGTSVMVVFALSGGGVDDKQGKQGDPVNTATGSFIYNLDLMPVVGRGLPFLFQAYYSSQAYRPAGEAMVESPPGSLGYGWSHTFETHVLTGIEDGVGYALVSFGDGHAEKFTFDPMIGWEAEPGNYNQLTEAVDGRFFLTTRSLLRHDFDHTGRLDGITDRNGNTLDVVWEGVPGDANSQRIQKVVLPGGPVDGSATREILFHYRPTAPKFLWRIEDPMHRHCEFTQDGNGDLVGYANELAHPTAYTYFDDSLHQMHTVTDAETHRVVRLFYNADRRVEKQEDASGNVTLFSYDFPAVGNRITTVTRLADPTYSAEDPRNEIVEDVHDQKLHLIERRVRVENPDPGEPFIWLAEKLRYDPVTGDLISKINRRNFETTYQYHNGNLTQVATPDTGITTFEYTDSNHPTLPTLITYPDARVKERREYDLGGNLIATTMPYDPAQPTKYRRTTIRDAFGQVTSTLDANGITQAFVMDEWGRNIKYTDGELKTHTNEFDANGRKTAGIDPRTNRTTFQLNAVGNLTHTIRADPNDGANPVTTQVIYDDTELPIQGTDPLNHSSYMRRDEQGRIVREENHERHPLIHRFDAFGRELETENAKGGITRRTFNFAGYLMSESSPAPSINVISYKRDANGNATEVTDGDGVRTTSEYDSMDRARVTKRWKSATEFEQTCTSYNLMGQKEWDEDQLGVRTYYHYNLAGDHVRTVTKGGTEYTFDYDFEGNLKSATHSSSTGSATRHQEYNGRYQLKKRIDENGHSEEFFYDDAGNLARHVQESNSATPIETTFVYDSLNRLTRINPPTGPPITFIYDKASRRIEMSDPTGTTKWSYSTLDQVASIEMPNGLKLTFSYDPLGATEIITYPGNRPATYVTDAAGRFQSVTDWSNRTISQTYTAGDRPLRLQFPNGVHTALAHDPLGRLNVVTHQKGSDPALRHLSYGFNALGQLDSIPDVQLTEPDSTYTCTYGKANELLSIAGSPVTHDGRGNLKTAKLSPASPATDTLFWDYANRLTGGTVGAAPFLNTFNGLGHRTGTTRSGVTTGFLHDDRHAMPRIMAETDAAGTPTAFYLYAGDTLLARILPDGSALWYHPDRQGNIVLLTDGSGSTAADYQYDPNGVLVSASGSFAASNRFRYLGGLGVWDNDDGTLHARARTYHPRLGSFLSNDPLFGSIQEGQSLNRYLYALGDPFGFSDPSGFSPVTPSIYLSPPAYSFWNTFSQDLATRLGYIAVGFAPGVGEAMDLEVVGDPNASPFAKSLASASLAASIKSGGFALNFGGLRRALAREVGSEGTFVYRGLAKGEDATTGLTARSPGAGNSEISHVAGKMQSQWISTTKDKATAIEKYGEHGVVRIDLSKVQSSISDVSGGFLNGGRMSNWARRDQEVLIQNFIPSEAIRRIK
jgi:RHS repeat-associated protein